MTVKILFLWIILLNLSCAPSKDIPDYGPGAYEIQGTMQLVDVEGGCWQFSSDDGRLFQLAGQNAAPLLKSDLRATLIVRDLHDVVTTCMVGKLVMVLEVVEAHN